MKKIKRMLITLIFTFVLCISNVSADCAADHFCGSNTGGNGAEGVSCGGGWCFYPGEWGVRISIINSKGVQKGKAVDIFISNVGRAKQKVTSYSRFSNGKISVNNPVMLSDMKFNESFMKGLVLMQNSGNNFSTVNTAINSWTTSEPNFIKIKEKSGVTSVSQTDYLIIEPILEIGKDGVYKYGTAKDLVKFITTNNPGTKNLLYNRAGYSIYSNDDNITKFGLSKITNSSPKIFYSDNYGENDAKVGSNTNIWNTNAYGVAIYSLRNVVPGCDLNNNNNGNATKSDTNYWTYYDASCNDGAGCWKKIKNGCCDTYSTKTNYSSTQVLAKYPECATCNVKTQLYIDNKAVDNLDSLECKNEAVTITNYKGTGGLKETTSDICLANNKLYSGIINGKRYGCEIKDSLTLPKEYDDILMIGQKFVWPTSNSIKFLGYFDNSYPVTRKTEINCIAYTYEKDGIKGNFSYVTLTDAELKQIEKKFVVSENLKLKYNGNDNGKIVTEKNKKTSKKSNVKFNFNIDVAYTLNKVNKTNGAYAYFNVETLKYMNKFVLTNRYKYYMIPVIPFGNYGDKEVKIEYGIEFSGMSVMGKENDKFSGFYVCDRDDEKSGSKSCECPLGTKYEGKILTPDEDDWVASCAALQDSECDGDEEEPIKCPNDASIDITLCVLNNEENADLTQGTAYDACVAVRCVNPPPKCVGEHCYPEPPIYRTIFLNNPFLKENGEKRIPRDNWGGKYSVDSNGKYIGLVDKYIISTKDYMYDREAMYSFTLTPEIINSIKDYNKGKEYNDFKLECDNDGIKCYSNFLHNTLEKVMSGTCGSIKSKSDFQNSFDKCRLESFEK